MQGKTGGLGKHRKFPAHNNIVIAGDQQGSHQVVRGESHRICGTLTAAFELCDMASRPTANLLEKTTRVDGTRSVHRQCPTPLSGEGFHRDLPSPCP